MAPPDTVTDVAGLVSWLRTRGPRSKPRCTTTAWYGSRSISGQPEDAIAPGDEIAVFPAGDRRLKV